jgi:hypothetical protein
MHKSGAGMRRGIWRHATQMETLPPQTAEDIELILRALPLEQLRAVGVRAALRAVPLMAPSVAALLRMLRIVSLGWTAASYPNSTANLVPLNVARIDAISTGLALLRAVAGAVSAFSANPFESIVNEMSLGIDVLRSASIQADGRAAGVVFALALTEDLRDLRGAPSLSADLVRTVPLWSGGAPPEWQARRWETMKRALIDDGDHWNVWVEWYEKRLAGSTRAEPREFAYVQMPGAIWATGDAADVNRWILGHLGGLADHADSSLGKSDAVLSVPSIPAQRPAAIEPVWRNGRITLRQAPAASDLKGRTLGAAFRALREDMEVFAADIATVPNIDTRFVSGLAVKRRPN